jgi:hypothetical protein
VIKGSTRNRRSALVSLGTVLFGIGKSAGEPSRLLHSRVSVLSTSQTSGARDFENSFRVARLNSNGETISNRTDASGEWHGSKRPGQTSRALRIPALPDLTGRWVCSGELADFAHRNLYVDLMERWAYRESVPSGSPVRRDGRVEQ